MTRLAIISPNRDAWSETFIQAHREKLFPDTRYLYGAWLPRYDDQHQHFLSDSSLVQGVVYHSEKLLGKPEHFRLKRAIMNWLTVNRIQVVLAEYGPTGVEMASICRRMSIPLVVHFHGYDVYEEEILKEYGGRYRELFFAAQKIIAVSNPMMARLKEMGAPENKLILNPCGPDTDLFQPIHAGDNPPHFIAVGRFAGTKGPWLTLEAFAQTLAKVPEARLTMIGEGAHWEACKKQAAELGIEASVEFPGILPHEEVVKAMQTARAFVQHSRTTETGDSEGTPVAIQEAGASGLPVVSTRHAGIPDVVIEEQTGFLVEEGDTKGMSHFMTRLARDPELATRMGNTAAAHIRANFSLEKHLDRLRGLLKPGLF